VLLREGTTIVINMNSVNRPERDKLSVLSGALLMGVVLVRFLESPANTYGTDVFGSRLGIDLSATNLMLLISGGMGITAIELLVRSHPIALRAMLTRSLVFWILPGLLMVGLVSWSGTIEDLGYWAAIIIASAFMIPVTLANEYAAVDPEQRQGPRMILKQFVIAYLVAAMFIIRVYDLQLRALIGSTAIVLLSTLLAYRLFWIYLDSLSIVLRFAVPTGLLIGILSWAVSHLPIIPIQRGLILFVMFYFVVGLLHQKLSGRFGRHVVLEYGGISALVTLFTLVGFS